MTMQEISLLRLVIVQMGHNYYDKLKNYRSTQEQFFYGLEQKHNETGQIFSYTWIYKF